jgi:hypothetical protein
MPLEIKYTEVPQEMYDAIIEKEGKSMIEEDAIVVTRFYVNNDILKRFIDEQ